MKIQIEESDLRSVLTALEEIHPGNMTPMAEEAWNKAITAIREALAEQPAHQDIPKIGCVNHDCDKCNAQQQEPNKPWVGLTEQERNDLEDYCEMIIGKAAFDAIEAKLKEKNNG